MPLGDDFTVEIFVPSAVLAGSVPVLDLAFHAALSTTYGLTASCDDLIPFVTEPVIAHYRYLDVLI